MQVYLTTAGSPDYLVIDGYEFRHPEVRKPLIFPDGFMTLEEFRSSTQFPAAVTANQITLVDDQGNELTDGNNVTQGAIAVFEDSQGKNLVGSGLVLNGNVVETSYDINLTGGGVYKQDGESIYRRDYQTKVLIDEEDTDDTFLSTLMSLTTRNSVEAFYRIYFEGLFWTSRNNRVMGLGLYLNGEEQDDHFIQPRFNRGNDHKTHRITAELLLLEPETLVEIKWQRIGSSVTIDCGRRVLTIEEILL